MLLVACVWRMCVCADPVVMSVLCMCMYKLWCDAHAHLAAAERGGCCGPPRMEWRAVTLTPASTRVRDTVKHRNTGAC